MNRVSSRADTIILDILADKRQLKATLTETAVIAVFMVAISPLRLPGTMKTIIWWAMTPPPKS